MIAETLTLVVVTPLFWKEHTRVADCVTVFQPYQYNGSDELFFGKCVYIQLTLGM